MWGPGCSRLEQTWGCLIAAFIRLRCDPVGLRQRTSETIQFMARQTPNPGQRKSAGFSGATLKILEWDEGEPFSQGWLGVAIPHRENYPSPPWSERARMNLERPQIGRPPNDEEHF